MSDLNLTLHASECCARILLTVDLGVCRIIRAGVEELDSTPLSLLRLVSNGRSGVVESSAVETTQLMDEQLQIDVIRSRLHPSWNESRHDDVLRLVSQILRQVEQHQVHRSHAVGGTAPRIESIHVEREHDVVMIVLYTEVSVVAALTTATEMDGLIPTHALPYVARTTGLRCSVRDGSQRQEWIETRILQHIPKSLGKTKIAKYLNHRYRHKRHASVSECELIVTDCYRQ